MKFVFLARVVAAFTFLVCSFHTNATVVMFDDRSTFESITGAVSAGNLTQQANGVEFSVGILDFKNANGSTLNTNHNFSTLISENWDLGISGPEHFDVLATSNIFAFGFDFHEPTNTTPPFNSVPDSCNTSVCINSIFEIGLFFDGAFVDNAQFGRPDDQLTFVGISSSNAFNEIRIRELVGNSDNEFFGNFTVATAVPGPSSLLMFLLGLLVLVSNRRS